jgi:surface protein
VFKQLGKIIFFWKFYFPIDLSNWNIEKLHLTINIFNKCIIVKVFIVNNQNKSIKNIKRMFYEFKSLKSVDLSNLDLRMLLIFCRCLEIVQKLQILKLIK